MKFYGNGIVWNAQAGRPLCRFEKGEFITEDESVIKALADLGYKHDEPLIKTIEVVETEPVDGWKTYKPVEVIKEVEQIEVNTSEDEKPIEQPIEKPIAKPKPKPKPKPRKRTVKPK